MRIMELPENANTAVMAGERLGSDIVVVISVNKETDAFDARCYGSTERGRYMAGLMVEAILKALDDSENEPDPDCPLFLSLSDASDFDTPRKSHS